jgi:hypothetical protein
VVDVDDARLHMSFGSGFRFVVKPAIAMSERMVDHIMTRCPFRDRRQRNPRPS